MQLLNGFLQTGASQFLSRVAALVIAFNFPDSENFDSVVLHFCVSNQLSIHFHCMQPIDNVVQVTAVANSALISWQSNGMWGMFDTSGVCWFEVWQTAELQIISRAPGSYIVHSIEIFVSLCHFIIIGLQQRIIQKWHCLAKDFQKWRWNFISSWCISVEMQSLFQYDYSAFSS